VAHLQYETRTTSEDNNAANGCRQSTWCKASKTAIRLHNRLVQLYTARSNPTGTGHTKKRRKITGFNTPWVLINEWTNEKWMVIMALKMHVQGGPKMAQFFWYALTSSNIKLCHFWVTLYTLSKISFRRQLAKTSLRTNTQNPQKTISIEVLTSRMPHLQRCNTIRTHLYRAYTIRD